MGIRLYPVTKNVEALEALAGVKPGSHQRLQSLREKHRIDEPTLTFWEREEAYGRFHDEVHSDRDLASLDAFLLFGWGKVYSREHQDDGGYGQINDVEEIARLFRANCINADARLTEGVYWA